MIIDAHAHLVTPVSIFGIRSVIQASNGQHSKAWYVNRWLNMDEVSKSAAQCIGMMNEVGTDIQLLSPRPFLLMHSHRSIRDVRIWIELQNDLIQETVRMHPTRFRGVAGLPQVDGEPIEIVFEELHRCIDELGFVGVLVNPDPSEGRGTSPRLGDPYWYPLWERLVKLNVPAHIHSAGCCGRETYDEHFATEESLAITSVIHSQVFQLYPDLKMMISHGGGSIPYQIGRWRARWFSEQVATKPHIAEYFKKLAQASKAEAAPPALPADLTSFDDALRQLYFDTDLHERNSLELLFKTVGADRCVFGTERPGSGNVLDPRTGHSMEDIKYTIDQIEFLDETDRQMIYETNARKLFPRLDL